MLVRNLIVLLAGFIMNLAFAESGQTIRVPQFANEKVKVWESVIYPSKKQEVTMHRHERDRVVVALDTGTLKITNEKHHVHFLKLEKDKSYFFPHDPKGTMHTDENVGVKMGSSLRITHVS